MRLCKLHASNSAAFWGEPYAPMLRNATIIGQAPDCTSFLILTTEKAEYLEEVSSTAGYTFTYCQSWGLTITPEVIRRVWTELRAKAYPAIGEQLDALYKSGAMPAALSATISEVKARIPKLTLP